MDRRIMPGRFFYFADPHGEGGRGESLLELRVALARGSEKNRVTATHQERTVDRRPKGAQTQQLVARGIATRPQPVHCILRLSCV